MEHYYFISRKCPNLTFNKLLNPIPDGVATPTRELSAVAFLPVPVAWEKGLPPIFSKLVVTCISSPNLFEENHLSMMQEHTDNADLKVHFCDQAIGFTIKCRDSNPLQAFLSLS